MNKKEFYKKMKDKQYDECIDILRKEIIGILVLKIKEKNQYFKYSTTKDLYNASKKNLEEKYSMIAYQLYNFDMIDERDEYVLDELFKSYEEFQKNK